MANEQAVGHPGGSTSPTGGTAAVFLVDDTSLQNMRKTWKGLREDILNVNKALLELRKGTKVVDDLVSQLGVIGIGKGVGSPTSGSGAVGGDAHFSSGPAAHPSPTGGEHTSGGAAFPPVGGDATFGGGSDGGGRPGLLGTGRRKAAAVGFGAFGLAGGYINSRMGDISDADLFFNQQAQAMGGPGYSGANKAFARNYLFGIGGGQSGLRNYQSTQDLLGGVQGLLGTVGGTVGSARTQGLLQSTGQLAALNPGAGYTGSAMATGGLYTPQTNFALMSMGASPAIGAGGRLNDPQQVYRSILQRAFRGRMPTKQELTEGMQVGSPLYNTLTRGLGLDQNTVQQVINYGIASSNLGGNQQLITQALNNPNGAAGRQAGLGDSIRSAQNRAGRASARAEQTAGAATAGTLENSFKALADVTDGLSATFRELNGHMHGALGTGLGIAGFGAGPVGGVLGRLGGIGGASFTLSSIGGLLRKGAARGGRVGKALGAAGGAADLVSKADSVPVFVTNWPGGGGGWGSGGNPLGGSRAARDVEDAEKGAKGGWWSRLKGRLGPSEGGGGLATAEVAPLAATAGITAAAGVALTATALVATGVHYGNMVDKYNARGSGAQNLTDFEVRLRRQGVIGQGKPGQAEFDSKAKPLIHKYLQTHKDSDWQAAFNALVAIEHKYIKNIHANQALTSAAGFDKLERPGNYGGGNSSAVYRSISGGRGGPKAGAGARGTVMPANGPITQAFGHNGHPGMDIGAGMDSPIYAAKDGTVVFSGPADGFGNAIVINHGNVETLYGHMKSQNLFVKTGQKVKAGQVISKVGSEGYSTGPHLHFELHPYHDPHFGGMAQNRDPAPWLHGAGVSGAAAPTTSGAGASAASGSTSSGTDMVVSGGATLSGSMEEVALLAAHLAGGGTLGHTSTSGATKSSTTSATAGGSSAMYGSAPNGTQTSNAKIIIQVAKQMGVGKRGAIIGIATALQESGLINLHSGDRDSQGLFQQRPSQGWGTVAQVTNPAYAARSFFSRLKGEDYQHMALTVAAQNVQRSAYPDAYAKWEGRATGIVNQLWSGGKGGPSPSSQAAHLRSRLSGAMPGGRDSVGMVVVGAGGGHGQVTYQLGPIYLHGSATQRDGENLYRGFKDAEARERRLNEIGSH